MKKTTQFKFTCADVWDLLRKECGATDTKKFGRARLIADRSSDKTETLPIHGTDSNQSLFIVEVDEDL